MLQPQRHREQDQQVRIIFFYSSDQWSIGTPNNERTTEKNNNFQHMKFVRQPNSASPRNQTAKEPKAGVWPLYSTRD